MLYVFPLLILTLITLLFYYKDKEKLNTRIDDLVSDLEKEMETKLNLESKYNKVLDDVKKEEELRRNKNIDEMQLLFTKVNLLDDKLTYFNTNFKSKLEQIFEMVKGSPVSSNMDFESNKTEDISNDDSFSDNLEDINEDKDINEEGNENQTFCSILDKTCEPKEDSFTKIDGNLKDELEIGDVFSTLNSMPESGGDTMSSIVNENNLEDKGQKDTMGDYIETEDVDNQEQNDSNQEKDIEEVDNQEEEEKTDRELSKEGTDSTNDISSVDEDEVLEDNEHHENDKLPENDESKEKTAKANGHDVEGAKKEDNLENYLVDHPMLDDDFLNSDSTNNTDVCPIDQDGNPINVKDDEITSALNELNKIGDEDISNTDDNEKNNIPPTTVLSKQKKNSENNINEDSEVSLDDGSFDIKDSIEKLKAQLDEDNKSKSDKK